MITSKAWIPSNVICLLIPFRASSSRLRLTRATYLMDTYSTSTQTHRRTDTQTQADAVLHSMTCTHVSDSENGVPPIGAFGVEMHAHTHRQYLL